MHVAHLMHTTLSKPSLTQLSQQALEALDVDQLSQTLKSFDTSSNWRSNIKLSFKIFRHPGFPYLSQLS